MDCRVKPGNDELQLSSQNFERLAMSEPLQIGLVIFPRVTQLDFTGPLQVFSSVPGAKVHLIWKRIEPVPSDSVLTLTPTITFADCPQLDVICVPGGVGTDDMVNDQEMLDFLRRQAEGAKYITSVCTGSLVLGAAGLLRVAKIRAKKKAAGFPRRPFLSYGSSTLTGDFRTSAPGAYFPAVSYSVAAAYRDSRELEPEPTRWFPTSVR